MVVSSEMRPHSKYFLTACAASVLLALIAAIHLLSASRGNFYRSILTFSVSIFHRSEAKY